MADRPNFLMIMADQLTALALGCYGNSVVKTPNIDRLAARGVVFENCYNNISICAPSRASMCSGILPAKLMHFDNGTEFPSRYPTFMHHLRHGGYEVLLSGKMHFVGADQYHGFERRLTTDIYPSGFKWTKDWAVPVKPALAMVGHLTDAGTRPWTKQMIYDEEVHYRALEQIRVFGGYGASRNGSDRPWFLCASYTHPHDPPFITEEWWNLYDEADIDMPSPNPHPDEPLHPADQWLMEYLGLDQLALSEEDVKRSRLGYYAMTSYFDSKVGELVDELEKMDLLDNTIVMVTSDHGDMVGEHEMWFKRSYYEWSSRVPWVVSCPSRYPQGRRVSGVTSLVDLFPTFLEMADLPAAENIDGHSAAGLMTADDPDWKDEAIIDFTSAGALHPWRAVRRGKYKYVNVYTAGPLLFDLENDPDEWYNLAGQAEVVEVEAELKARSDEGWNAAAIDERERVAQQERLFIQAAHEKGEKVSWDCQPFVDASKMYTR